MDKDDAKSRGLKHRTSKKKYNKHKPGAHVPTVKPKVTLESNWDRYEQKEGENKVNSSTDFSVLANAPITLGSHFQFKSDKDILDISEPVTSDLFNLDLTLLEKSLSTIPFNVRTGINAYISEGRQKVMTALADNVNDYQSYLETYKNKDPDVIFGSESESSSGDSDGSEVPQTLQPKNDAPDDLEQWLDDVLDA